MQSAAEMVSNYRLQEKLKREAEEEVIRKEKERKARLQCKIYEAIIQAQKIQQTQPPNKLYVHPVEGTSLYVDARGIRYDRVDNQLVPIGVARPAWTPRPIRRRWRM